MQQIDPIITFYTINGENEQFVEFKCKIDRCDGFTAVGEGQTKAEALLIASVKFYNRQQQENSRREYDLQQADKNNYRPNHERYRAKRFPTVSVITTDTLMDISLFASQMKSVSKMLSRSVNDDWEERLDDVIKMKIESVDFMLPEQKEDEQKKNRRK